VVVLGGGRSIAPYVKANRRDHGLAVVHGRSGKFLELAVALFCGVDVFKNSEVEAAVTNVYEAQGAANNERQPRRVETREILLKSDRVVLRKNYRPRRHS
jgi:hypothetical protein